VIRAARTNWVELWGPVLGVRPEGRSRVSFGLTPAPSSHLSGVPDPERYGSMAGPLDEIGVHTLAKVLSWETNTS